MTPPLDRHASSAPQAVRAASKGDGKSMVGRANAVAVGSAGR